MNMGERAGRLQRNWYTRSRRRRSWILYFTPIILTGMFLGIDWLRLHLEGPAGREEARRLLAHVGYVQYISAGTMLITIRKWSMEKAGLFLILLAGAELKVRLLANYGPQPVAEWERDLIQAGFDVGTVLIALSIIFFSGVSILRLRKDRSDKRLWKEEHPALTV